MDGWIVWWADEWVVGWLERWMGKLVGLIFFSGWSGVWMFWMDGRVVL